MVVSFERCDDLSKQGFDHIGLMAKENHALYNLGGSRSAEHCRQRGYRTLGSAGGDGTPSADVWKFSRGF